MLGGDCLYSSWWSSLAAGLSLVPHPALPVEQLEFAFSSLSLADPRWNWPTGSASVEMQTLAEIHVVMLRWRSGRDFLFSELIMIRVRVPCSGKSQMVKHMVRAGRVRSGAAPVMRIPVLGGD